MNSSGKTIVLVDDDQAYIDFLATMLVDVLAAPVHAFTRPNEALAALPDLNAAVVVTDYWMPEMNGFDFIRAASSLVAGVPFIVISGHAVHLAEQDLSNLKALRAIVPKPFSYRKLAEVIVTHAPELRQPDPTTV